MQLQESLGASISPKEEMTSLVEYIDLDRSGKVTFLEFVAAFGLDGSDDTENSTESSNLAVLIMQQEAHYHTSTLTTPPSLSSSCSRKHTHSPTLTTHHPPLHTPHS